MKLIFMILATFIMLFACSPKPKTTTLSYQNIIIFSDLSDRIDPIINGQITNQQYPTKDLGEIRKILDYFRNECVKPGEKIGDRSTIQFSTFNNEIEAKISLDDFKEIGVKQEFINSTGKYLNQGLDYEISKFEELVEQKYENTRNNGLDLISVLLDQIQNKSLLKFDTLLLIGKDTTRINFDNHIYIFTDGYLEYKGKSVNNQFYFSHNEIENIRAYCKANKVDIKTALDENPEFCLQPVKSDLHKLITLHVLETHERDKNSKLQTYKNPTGLRDNEILHEVWKKWAAESGFKELNWRKY